MWTLQALVQCRIAALALLAVFMASQASAEICVYMDLRFGKREQPPALIESMTQEAASIWEPYGVRFEWRAAQSPSRCSCTQASFTVLLDHQHPRSSGFSLPTTLGSTRLVPRAIEQAPIYIDREATEELLGSLGVGQLAPLLGRSSVGPADVGRALGRILAHEVGHVLLADRDHQPRGLMRKGFGAGDLLTPERGAYGLLPADVARLGQREQTLNAMMNSRATSVQIRR